MEDLDIITRSVRIENHSDAPIYLESVQSTCVDYLHGEFDLHTFYGRHVKERNYQRAAVHHGIQSVGDFDFAGYLFDIIMPELVYTILVTLLLYQIILKINKKLEAEEQRSASKFV